MEAPAKPANEQDRLKALFGLCVLDTPDEERFDRLTRVAQKHFEVPIALVSLVDGERQWFKSRQGLEATETPREISFCGHAILGEGVFEVANALDDPRFADNPLVTSAPDIRFYAGAPLSDGSGMKMGTLCIIDTQPRTLSDEDKLFLRDLADIAEAELRLTFDLEQAAEESSRDQRAQMDAIVNTVIDGIITIDDRGTVETFNPAAARIFGYEAAEVVGRNVRMLMPEPFHGEHDGYLESFLRTGGAKVIGIGREVVGRRKDGTTFPMELAIGEMAVAGRRMFTGIVRDITEQKEVAKRLAAIITAIQNSQMVAEFAMDGTILAANDHFCKVFGYRAEELRNQRHSLFVDPEIAQSSAYREFWAALNRGEFQAAKFTRIGKGGKEVWIQATYTPILNSIGEPDKVIKFATDVTENVKTELDFRDSQIRTRTILETVVDGIITIDDRGTVETFNPAAARIFGYEAAEVLGRNVRMLMPEPIHDEYDGYLESYLRTGDAKVIGIGREVVGRRKDGTTFPMELAIGEMAVAGRRMFTGIVRDITERKRVERLKAEFVSTVSHELRTPLTSIKGSLGLIRTGAVGALPDALKRMLEIAYVNSDRLVHLINDILDMEKIESGNMEFRMAPLNLATVLNQALEANKDYGRERGVGFRLTGGLREAPVNGDPDRLMQVLANLMSNAAKFSPDGGTVEITLERRGDGFRVAVADRGPGVPVEFRDRIFGKFAQADSSDSRQKGGTGLGLNISKEIVERHGGTIGFETEIGAGSTFYFDLPARVAAPAPAASGKYRALVCEDDPDIAALIGLMLQTDGFGVDIAETAAAARALLGAHRYDVMTLDIGLPDLDGMALLSELRAEPATAELPVIVISAKSTDGSDALRGQVLGIIDWIQKPIDHDRLAATLRRLARPVAGGKRRILHVEDDPDVLDVVAAIVGELAEVTPANSFAAARALLKREKFDLVLLDLELPDGRGEKLICEMHGTVNEATPVVVFSVSEFAADGIERIRATLLKTKTSNETLQQMIRAAIDRRSVPRTA